MNDAERLVQELCRKSFLSMWSIPNPQGKEAGKELCDVLVVCDPDVVIISVKEITYRPTDDYKTGADRWRSRAIEASAKQIYGAERILGLLGEAKGSDGNVRLRLPPQAERRIHRIAVALGSEGELPLWDGDMGKGFVHVLDEKGLDVVMRELDTISDFVHYLTATETFLETTQVVTEGLESLLGYYLQNGRKYPESPDLLILTDDIWGGLTSQEAFARRKEADQDSYFWDRLIEHVTDTHDPSLTQAVGDHRSDNPAEERVLRILAREDRFSRRVISKAFIEFHRDGTIRARMIRSPSGVLYVFLIRPREYDRTLRSRELLARMFIARGLNQEVVTVVGIATEEYTGEAGFSIDVAGLEKPEWTAEDQREMTELQDQTGAFASPQYTQAHEDEYPEESNEAEKPHGA